LGFSFVFLQIRVDPRSSAVRFLNFHRKGGKDRKTKGAARRSAFESFRSVLIRLNQW
jgi:hypothetical protein